MSLSGKGRCYIPLTERYVTKTRSLFHRPNYYEAGPSLHLTACTASSPYLCAFSHVLSGVSLPLLNFYIFKIGPGKDVSFLGPVGLTAPGHTARPPLGRAPLLNGVDRSWRVSTLLVWPGRGAKLVHGSVFPPVTWGTRPVAPGEGYCQTFVSVRPYVECPGPRAARPGQGLHLRHADATRSFGSSSS